MNFSKKKILLEFFFDEFLMNYLNYYKKKTL